MSTDPNLDRAATPTLPGMDEFHARHGLLRIGDVCRMIGLKRWSVYNLVRRGELPPPVKLRPGGRASAWRAADVIAFIESREVDPLARPVTVKSPADAPSPARPRTDAAPPTESRTIATRSLTQPGRRAA